MTGKYVSPHSYSRKKNIMSALVPNFRDWIGESAFLNVDVVSAGPLRLAHPEWHIPPRYLDHEEITMISLFAGSCNSTRERAFWSMLTFHQNQSSFCILVINMLAVPKRDTKPLVITLIVELREGAGSSFVGSKLRVEADVVTANVVRPPSASHAEHCDRELSDQGRSRVAVRQGFFAL